MDVLDRVVRFCITISCTLMVQMVIIWYRSQISLCDVVSMGNVFQVPDNPQKPLVPNFMGTSYVLCIRR